MNRYIRMTFFLSTVFIIAACVPTKTVDISQYQRVKADTRMAACKPPDYIVKHKKPGVAVSTFEDLSGTQLKNLGKLATEEFQNMITDMGRFNVIERAQAKKLDKELDYENDRGLSDEAWAKKHNAIGKCVNYVIVGAVKDVTPNVSQNPGYRDTKGSWVPPLCKATVQVSVAARVIKMATGRTMRSFEMQGDDTETQRTGCQVTVGMARKAMEKAIKRQGRVDIARTIPIIGYVKRLMTGGKNGKDRIAYISLGQNDGIQPGDEIQVMKIEEDVDSISGKHETRYINITKGIVAKNGLSGTECLLILNGDHNAGRVKVGNMVEQTAKRFEEESQWGNVKDIFKNALNTIER